MSQLTEYSGAIYWLVGLLIIANVGSIGACFMAALRVTWWASKVDSRLMAMESTRKEDRDELDSVRSDVRTLMSLVQQRRHT